MAVVVPASGFNAESPKCTRDPVHVDGQDLGGDLGERARLPPADVGHAAPNGERPVHLEPDPRGRRVVQPHEPPVGLHVRGDRAADGLARSARRRLVAGALAHGVDRLGELDLGDDLLAHREPVAAAQGVPLADLARVEPQPLRELVHLRLIAQDHLHPAEPTERRRGRVVRVGGGGTDARMLQAVGTARVHRRVEQHERREVRVRPGVGDDPDVLREDRAVVRGGGAVGHVVAVPLRAREQRLVAGPLHAHGPARVGNRQREVRLDGHVLLAAEPAAHVRRDHAHLRVGHAQDLRDVAVVLHHLGRDAQIHHAVVVVPADAGLGLQVGVVDELRRVLALDHDVGGGERRVDVAAVDAPLGEQVPALVDLEGVVGERVGRLGDHGQLLVLDLDGLAGLGERVLVLGDHERDRLAVEAHALGREDLHARLQGADRDRLAGDVDADLVVRDVLAEQHGDHARDLRRRASTSRRVSRADGTTERTSRACSIPA